MKFLSTAIATALAGLSLLVPAVYGDRQYRCQRGNIISEKEVLSNISDSALTPNREEHPDIPTGESHTTYFYTDILPHQLRTSYLIQVYGKPPNYQFSQYSREGWKLCTLENMN